MRTAEVTARFTLDALPGKQMAIDADMNAGLIDEQGARKRREAIAREAEFYGAMDGAARFNQRDSLATILITAINIVAGLLIGVLQQGVDLMTAVKTYTILTVGDGLVTMIPSLLVSIAGGLVLTRASSAGTLDEELGQQLFARRNTLYMAAGVLAALALVPGLPKLAFWGLALGVVFVARQLPAQTSGDADVDIAGKSIAAAGSDAPGAENLAGLLKVDDLTLEIGFQLIPHGRRETGRPDAQPRARPPPSSRHGARLHRPLRAHHGQSPPPSRASMWSRCAASRLARWQTEGDCLLAVNSDPRARPLPGVDTREPAFNVAAKWIQPGLEDQALASGYSVVDQTAVIGTHLAELIRRHAHELLGRAETKRLLDSMNESHPKLVEELVPKLMSLGEVQKVLQQLLREQVSIRDLGTVLETLVECAAVNKNVVYLVEQTRQAMGRGLVRSLLDHDGGLPVLTLDPRP